MNDDYRNDSGLEYSDQSYYYNSDEDGYFQEPVLDGEPAQEPDPEEEDIEEETEGRGRSPMRVVVYFVCVLLVSAVLSIAMWLAADDVLALTKPDNTITITISDTDSLSDVAQILADHGLVRYKWLFVLYGKFSHAEDKIDAGTYDLNQLYDYHALVNGMVTPSQTQMTVTLTFPEGYSCEQIFELLDQNDVCSLADLRDTAANYPFGYSFLRDLDYGDSNRLEGFLFPDTYNFYVDDDPVNVLDKLLSNFDSKWTDEMTAAVDELNDNLRIRMEEEGTFSADEIDSAMMTPYKIITMASLVEKEAGSDGERQQIAGVIYNRLTSRVEERLQIDATVVYAWDGVKTTLTANDLSIDSPYNTYKYKGLPPGPIANPGLASILAALYPSDSDYYYYALNSSTGVHEFFTTYYDQQAFLNGNTGTTDADADENEAVTVTDTNGDGVIDDQDYYYQTTVTNEDGEEETVNAQ